MSFSQDVAANKETTLTFGFIFWYPYKNTFSVYLERCVWNSMMIKFVLIKNYC